MKRLAAACSVRCKKTIEVTLLCTIMCIGQLYGMDSVKCTSVTEFGKMLHRDMKLYKGVGGQSFQYTQDLIDHFEAHPEKRPENMSRESVFKYWWASHHLYDACLFCNTEYVKKLIEIDEADVNSFPFLSLAIGNQCKPDMFKLLLDSGADVHAIDKFGKTPLGALEAQRGDYKPYDDDKYKEIKFLFEEASKREKAS